MQEIVILSDDEDDDDGEKVQTVTIKTEPVINSSINLLSTSNLVDLTDEVFEETDVPRHYISWLSDLIAQAKSKPAAVDQRLGAVTISNDIIIIDDPEETSDKNKTSTKFDEV